MKTKTFIRIYMSVLGLLLLSACGGSDEPSESKLPFNMEQQAEIVEGCTAKQSIYTGNGDYDIRVSDPAVAKATYSPPFGGIDYGAIVIEGLRQGQTTVSVTDRTAQRTIDISVRVISPNFYMMSMASSNHKALDRTVVSCFVPSDKTERDVLFFRSDGKGLKYMTRGTYRTEKSDDDMMLVMTYPCSLNDSTFLLTKDAVMMEHRFNLKGSSTAAIDILSAQGPLSEHPAQRLTPAKLQEAGTEYRMEANIVYGPDYTLIIPYGYLE